MTDEQNNGGHKKDETKSTVKKLALGAGGLAVAMHLPIIGAFAAAATGPIGWVVGAGTLAYVGVRKYNKKKNQGPGQS